jgi:hypothetical protein
MTSVRDGGRDGAADPGQHQRTSLRFTRIGPSIRRPPRSTACRARRQARVRRRVRRRARVHHTGGSSSPSSAARLTSTVPTTARAHHVAPTSPTSCAQWALPGGGAAAADEPARQGDEDRHQGRSLRCRSPRRSPGWSSRARDHHPCPRREAPSWLLAGGWPSEHERANPPARPSSTARSGGSTSRPLSPCVLISVPGSTRRAGTHTTLSPTRQHMTGPP